MKIVILQVDFWLLRKSGEMPLMKCNPSIKMSLACLQQLKKERNSWKQTVQKIGTDISHILLNIMEITWQIWSKEISSTLT